MFTAIVTAAWRGFGFDKGKGYSELRFGFISFAIMQGTIWKRYEDLKKEAEKLKQCNAELMNRYNDICGND